MLKESGYKKNVSLKRFVSHFEFGHNLKKYLKHRKVPDIILCTCPSLDAAYVAAKYATKHGVRLILDIQDLWPEAFKLAFDLPIISDLIFAPMKWKADKIYSYADEIVAVSETYCDRAHRVNQKVDRTHCVYIGKNIDEFSLNARENLYPKNNKFRLGYCGTLGHSYDLVCVFDAMRNLMSRGIDDIEFVVMGDGPKYNEFREYADRYSLPVDFLGRVEYPKMCGILKSCDVCMNVISKGAAQSVIGKHADYAAVGLPIINTQECAEYRSLIDDYGCGINCECGDSIQVAEAILTLMNNEKMRTEMGTAALIMASEKFDRKEAYKEIFSLISKTE